MANFISRKDIVDIELNNSGSIYRSFLAKSIGRGDKYANVFGVRLTRDQVPLSLTSSTVEGFFMAPDGTNILITGDTATGTDGNAAWVNLPAACYNVEGQFSLAIKLVSGPYIGTMRIVDGVVDNTGTDSPVAPTASVPTYEEIISQYELMVAATEDAEEAIGTMGRMINENIADPSHFLDVTGCTEDGGIYTMTAKNLAQSSDLNPFPVDGAYYSQAAYNISMKFASNGSTGTGLFVIAKYTDGTQDEIAIPNATGDLVQYILTTDSRKTVSAVYFGYGTNATIYIKDFAIQLAETDGICRLDTHTLGAKTYYKRFALGGSDTHSSTSDQMRYVLKEGAKYYVRVISPADTNGDAVVFCFTDDSNDGTEFARISRSNRNKFLPFNAPMDATRLGLYIRGAGTDQTVSFEVVSSEGLFTDMLNSVKQEPNEKLIARMENAKLKRNPYKRSNQASEPEVFGLAHFSDIHGHGERLMRIQEFIDNYGAYFDDTICTGDLVYDKFSDDFTYWSANSDGKILTCIGNHDSGESGWGDVSLDDLYDKFIAPFASGWGATTVTDKTYYYKDYTAAKVRLIVLDTTTLDATEQAAQLTWLASTLSAAKTAGYTVVGAQHYTPKTGEFTRIECNFTPLLHGTAASADYDWQPFLDQVMAAVQTFIDGGGNFACWLCGHIHHDFVCYDTSYPKQLFIGVTTAMASDAYDEEARTGYLQDAVNILYVDSVRKYIKLLRWGADYDDVLRRKESLVIQYGGATQVVLFQG